MNENTTKRTTNEPDDVGFAAFPGRLYVDRRVEDYEYNAKTGFTDCERGEKMNEVNGDDRKQVSQQSVELKLSIDCLLARMGVLEEALEKVLKKEKTEDIDGTPPTELVPLARFLADEKNRVTFANCWIESILNRLEL